MDHLGPASGGPAPPKPDERTVPMTVNGAAEDLGLAMTCGAWARPGLTRAVSCAAVTGASAEQEIGEAADPAAAHREEERARPSSSAMSPATSRACGCWSTAWAASTGWRSLSAPRWGLTKLELSQFWRERIVGPARPVPSVQVGHGPGHGERADRRGRRRDDLPCPALASGRRRPATLGTGSFGRHPRPRRRVGQRGHLPRDGARRPARLGYLHPRPASNGRIHRQKVLRPGASAARSRWLFGSHPLLFPGREQRDPAGGDRVRTGPAGYSASRWT